MEQLGLQPAPVWDAGFAGAAGPAAPQCGPVWDLLASSELGCLQSVHGCQMSSWGILFALSVDFLFLFSCVHPCLVEHTPPNDSLKSDSWEMNV